MNTKIEADTEIVAARMTDRESQTGTAESETRSVELGAAGSRSAGPRPEHRFFAADLSVDIARALVAPLAEIKKHDAEIWDQAYRALKGMALCVAEGGRRRKMDRANFFDMAAGSAQELRMALTLAVTFGGIAADTIAPIDRMIDRLLGMLWKLARRAEADAAIAKRRR